MLERRLVSLSRSSTHAPLLTHWTLLVLYNTILDYAELVSLPRAEPNALRLGQHCLFNRRGPPEMDSVPRNGRPLPPNEIGPSPEIDAVSPK